MTLGIGAYFFLIAFILAHLEIQIEGPHGWAEKLPTWRWDGRFVRRWFGKPVTGYHLCLVTLILLFLHVPQLYVPRPYLLGITLSLCAGLAPALWTGAWVERGRQWSIVFVELLALTVIVTVFTLRPRREEAATSPGAQRSAKVKP